MKLCIKIIGTHDVFYVSFSASKGRLTDKDLDEIGKIQFDIWCETHDRFPPSYHWELYGILKHGR